MMQIAILNLCISKYRVPSNIYSILHSGTCMLLIHSINTGDTEDDDDKFC